MEQSVYELCWLIQETLYENSHDFTITDSERLFEIAKENGLSGTVFEVIKNHGISSSMYKKFQTEFYLYVAQDEKQLRMIELIKGLLNANNIKYKFLKGSILKNIYPKTYMRAMGDIDFLILQKDKAKVHELLERVDVHLHSKGYVHDYYISDSEIRVEVHTRLTKEPKLYPDLERIEDIVLEKKESLELEVLYYMYHIKKHLITSGIGLRSILDIGVFLQFHKQYINQETLKKLLKENNLDILFERVMQFNEEYLGNGMFAEYTKGTKVNTELFELFTNYIITSGIHGWGISFNSYSGIISSNKKNSFKRLRYLVKIVFLSYDELKYIYPRFLKTRFLLPIAWMFRVYDLIFKDRKRRKKRLQLLFDESTLNKSVANMFEELGL